jgi:transcriptional regulator with XRE-family HTH domain
VTDCKDLNEWKVVNLGMRTLGQTLKDYRLSIPLTLRQVEEAIEISNAYLSQLENDKIKKPSADVLYKLSSLYKVNIEVFLIAAGIIKDGERVFHSMAEPITPEEEKELLNYLNFLRFGKMRRAEEHIAIGANSAGH